MRTSIILLVYGGGGHRAQMERLYCKLSSEESGNNIVFVGLCEKNAEIHRFVNYAMPALRDKYSWYRAMLLAPFTLCQTVLVIATVARRYRVAGVISTGPGLAIIPSLFFKIIGARIVFLETWSRFDTLSMAGRVMYKISDRFYIQNKSLGGLYPKARYGGLL